jgi:hypothetical protein
MRGHRRGEGRAAGSVPVRLLGATLAVVVATALLDRHAARADFLYGVTLESNTLLRIDPATGASTVIAPIRDADGNPTVGAVEALDFDNGGDLVAIHYSPGVPGTFADVLSRVDPATGRFQLIGRAVNYTFIEGTANVDGTLYGSASSNPSDNPASTVRAT